MKSTFADSYFFIALLNPRDTGHLRAVEASRNHVGTLITTEWILIEVGDAMAARPLREKFLELVDSLQTDASVDIVPANSNLFAHGIQLYRERPDKDWPLTDCLSFVVMREYGLHEAFTADTHFEQAGFRSLLR